MRTKNWCHANNFSMWGASEYKDLQREKGGIGVFVKDKDFDSPEIAMLNPPTSSRLNVLELWAGHCGLVHLNAPLIDFSLLLRLIFLVLGGTMANRASTTTPMFVGNIYMIMCRSIQLLDQFGVCTSFVIFNSTVCCPIRFKEHNTSQ